MDLLPMKVSTFINVKPPLVKGTTAAGALVELVAPFAGTVDCRWFFFTPAALPFGMVKLAPDTSGHGGYPGGGNITGYNYRDDSIVGFSHLHEHKLGAILAMATVGDLRTTPGSQAGEGYRSRFDKSSEAASPGYYSVFLEDFGVRAELTATTRVGFHRYTFPATSRAHIILDIGHNLGESGIIGHPVKDASLSIVNDTEAEGFVAIQPPLLEEPVKVFFLVKFSRPFGTCGTFREDVIYPGRREAKGAGIGMYADYSTKDNEAVELRVALSFVNLEQARVNMASEANNLSFDEARSAARDVWNRELGRIEVAGGSEDDRRKFYTALWHVLLGRGVASDANGKYADSSGKVAQIPLKEGRPEYSHFNSDSLWGAQWNIGQVWSLSYPEQMNSFIRSLLDTYDQSGWIPDGILVDRFMPGLPTNHATPFVVSAFQKGIRNYDEQKTYRALHKNQTEFQGRPQGAGNQTLRIYAEKGFVPIEEPTYGAVSDTLGYAYSDWCLAQMAKAMGHDADAAFFSTRSQSYRNVFDPSTLLMRPRKRDGTFYEKRYALLVKGFNTLSGYGFAEGNAWQYTWYVPHDLEGLTGLMGKELFGRRLNFALTVAAVAGFGGEKNTGGYSAPYNHGNQTDLQAVYLFNYLGKPWLTQKWAREVMDRFFGITPGHGYGLGQDEDQGQLGGWYVLSAMGLFDVQGGCSVDPVYQIGSPVFERVVLHLDGRYYKGGEFVIETRNNSKENRYIQSATLNGKPLAGPWLYHRELANGGRLLLHMGPRPNRDWGGSRAARSKAFKVITEGRNERKSA